MHHLPWARKTDSKQREFYARLRVARFDVAMLAGALVWCAPTAWCVEAEQDSGSRATEYFGNGAEINVIVHDGTGNPISSTTMVRLYRDGNIPSGQGATSHGRVRFVVTNLGEFTVVVEPAGQAALHQDVSVHSAGERQVDVYLPPPANGATLATGAAAPSGAGSAARVILAPKAQEAFDKGLRALSTDNMRDAEKYVGEAARLAPSHPDVLYVQGVLYLKEKNWSDAQAALEKATQIDPSHARAFAALGMALADQGKSDAAIAPLEKSLELDGSKPNWETEFVLARSYYASAKYPESLTISKRALADANGRAPEISLLVAQALTVNGQYGEAEETLRTFLREHGDRSEAAKARRWLEKLEARN
ncbi:MAG TPA: tetratricopeptide repeat protein [Candidatus Acidoferrum sp.]|jgi:Flp pilus assembly protein TadD